MENVINEIINIGIFALGCCFLIVGTAYLIYTSDEDDL